MEQRKIVSIEQLRGLAALGVVLCHVTGEFYHIDRYSAGPGKLFGWAGQVGVALFFVVSGFCIRLPLARARTKNPAARLEVKDYLAHRALRILPPYWAALVLSILVGGLGTTGLVGAPHDALDVLIHAVGLHSLTPSSYKSINGAFWSISLEIQFYLGYLLIANRPAGARSTLALTVMALAAYAVASLVFPHASPWRLVGQASVLTTFWQWYLGVALADLYASREPLSAPAWRVWTMRAAALALCFSLGLGDPVVANVHLTWWLLPLAAAAVVASCLVKPIGGERAGPIGAAMERTGRVSYSLYLLHPLAIALVVALERQDALPAASAALLAGTGALAAAWLGWRLIEQPLLTQKRRIGSTVEPAPLPGE